MRRLGPLWGGAVALASSSLVRMPGAGEDGDEPAPAWLIVVGALLGLAGTGAMALARGAGVPAAACATIGVLVSTALAGALLERGLAGTLPRHTDGAAAALAVAGALLVRVQLVAAMPAGELTWGVPALGVAGRWAAVFLQGLGDPIVDAPARSLVTRAPAAWELAAISAAVALAGYVALGPRALAALVLAAGAAFSLGLVAQRRRGGLDADVVGAVALCGEVLAALALTAAR